MGQSRDYWRRWLCRERKRKYSQLHPTGDAALRKSLARVRAVTARKSSREIRVAICACADRSVLEEALEEERTRLMLANSMLGCGQIALDPEAISVAPPVYFPEVLDEPAN